MKRVINNAKSLEFAAMIFMFGNTEIIATHENSTITIRHRAGADGGTDKDVERVIDDKEFAILLKELSEHDFSGEYDGNLNNIKVIDDKSDAPIEWYFRAVDEDENDLMYVRGNSNKSDDFKYLSNTLSKYYTEFGEVEKIFSLAAGDSM